MRLGGVGRIVFAILVALATPASAEERLELATLPDASNLELDASQITASLDVGPGEQIGTAELTAGLRRERTMVQLSSAVSSPPRGGERRHRHRLTASSTLHHGKRLGLHLALTAWLIRSGNAAAKLAPAKLGFLPTRRSGLELSSTLGVEESDKRDGAVIGVPVRYRAERVEWLSGPLRSSESRSLSLGLGPHPDVDEVLRVSNIAGATVEHVTFTRRGTMAATKGLPPTDAFRKVFVGFDSEAVFTFDDGGERLVAAAQARIGWSWLEADRGGTINKDNAADVRVGMNAKLGRPDHQFRFGFGYGREPNRSANGDRLIADWRLDLSAGLEQKRGEVAVRGTLSLIESLAGATEGEDVSNLLRYGTHLEAFYKLGSGFQAGGYLVTNYEPIGSLDPWQQKRSLAREVGLTLRWRRPLHRR